MLMFRHHPRPSLQSLQSIQPGEETRSFSAVRWRNIECRYERVQASIDDIFMHHVMDEPDYWTVILCDEQFTIPNCPMHRGQSSRVWLPIEPFRKKTVHGKGIGFCGSPDCRKVGQLSSEPVPYASITIEEESIILLFLSGLLMVRETPSTSRVGLRLSVCPASHFVLKHI